MHRFVIFFGLFILVTFASLSLAGIPKMINYQGMLTDNSGTPLTGSYDLTFKIWTDTTGGSTLWTEAHTGVQVQNGLFNVILGRLTALNLPFDQQYWLEVLVGAEAMPRIRFTSVGYAYRASVADSARVATPGSGSHWTVSDSVLYTNNLWGIARGGADNVLSGYKPYTQVNLGVSCTTSIWGENGYPVGATIGGGYGNRTGDSYATIGGGENNRATYDADYATVAGGQMNDVTYTFAAIGGGHGNKASGYSATVAGGEGNVSSGNWATIPGGKSNLAQGNYSFAAGWRAKTLHRGAFVWADSTDMDFNSQGVNTFNIRATGGVYSISNSSTYGAQFQNDGNGDGIRSYTNTSNGNPWGAVYAINNGASPAIYTKNVGAGKAGYFDGAVEVVGFLYKTGGGFKIDHPVDPENKYLYHSFVESPDMKNVYDGVVTLDANGEAEVELSGWVESLNRDFRYQLTCIGAFAPVFIAEKINDNRFKIAGGQPGMEVSWQVTGIRKDPYAEKHRIPVAEDKSANERGKYLHPEAYNLPETMGINYTDKK